MTEENQIEITAENYEPSLQDVDIKIIEVQKLTGQARIEFSNPYVLFEPTEDVYGVPIDTSAENYEPKYKPVIKSVNIPLDPASGQIDQAKWAQTLREQARGVLNRMKNEHRNILTERFTATKEVSFASLEGLTFNMENLEEEITASQSEAEEVATEEEIIEPETEAEAATEEEIIEPEDTSTTDEDEADSSFDEPL